MTAPLEAERNRALLDWYREHGRDLPWRRSPDPYSILVAEVMSQQTQAERVATAHEAFVATFPTIEALAAASLRQVMAAWSGLGYNTRAERLHRAARIIAESGWPTDAESLRALPGVGPYTARAVAAIAFGERVAAVDTNVRRVLSRWHGEPLHGPALEAAAAADVAEDASAWNQAVMDLGAGVCRPRNPSCQVCPVETWCAGPGVYVPPRAQPRFEGSIRQVRGALVRALVRREATLAELSAETGFAPARVSDALDHLTAEGIVEPDGDRYRVAGGP